jgi:hypothetical protein
LNKPKFTPGPWHVSDLQPAYIHYCVDGDDGWRELVAAAIPIQEDAEAQHSNAHLIAAAPEMYDALENALKWFHDPVADRLEEWERIAHEFYKETGYLRPGKSWPMGVAVPDDVESVWFDWCNRRSIEALNAMRLALVKARGETL